ncbi:hypothetical protein [Paraburkholderia sp. J8-2]|uniref:hypothetical protein n=1 Tax=Paraburkholderia sp. J8-2 TaxID=2805440 RepID=UPI002AB748CD|nr:hypothetical protein [Paraburkholderia sp. J8-2]
MSAGFQAWTDTGLVTIDGSTPCFGLRVHQVITSSNQSIAWGGGAASVFYMTVPIASITFTAAAPVVAFYSPSTYCQMIALKNNGGNSWTAQFWTQSVASIEVYVFDQTNQFAGSNYGLQVFDGSGQLIADATAPFLKPMGFISGNIFGSTGNSFITHGYSSPNYQSWAIASAKCATAAPLAASAIGNYIWLDGWSHSGGTATHGWFQLAKQGSGNDNNLTAFVSEVDWSGLLIDVANF